jgi:hypothetical protein
MHLDSLLQLARYAAILRRAADAYPPGKFATHCCFISAIYKCACVSSLSFCGSHAGGYCRRRSRRDRLLP